MKKHLFSRSFINTALLLSSLVLLSGCNPFSWVKNKTGCEGCGAIHGDGSAQGETLVSIRGKPAVTTACYQEYWEDFVKSDPRVESILPFAPNLRSDICKQLVNEKIIQEWIKDKKIDQTPEYQKKLKKSREVTDRLVALQAFQEDVLKSIDQSDAGAEKYYNENRDKNPVFQNPPFAQTAGGIKAQTVTFSDEKQAKDFLAKVQKAGADFAATAKAAKKDVKDLGVVNDQSRNADFALKAKLKDMQPGSVDLVTAGKNQFVVVKAGEKQAPKFAPFTEVKDYVKELMLRDQFEKALTTRLDELKKSYEVQEEGAKSFFEKEREKSAAEMQEKMKALQPQGQAGQTPEAQKADQAAPAPQATPAESATKAA